MCALHVCPAPALTLVRRCLLADRQWSCTAPELTRQHRIHMLHGTANDSYNMKHLLAIASLSGPTLCRVLLAVVKFVPHDSHLLLLRAFGEVRQANLGFSQSAKNPTSHKMSAGLLVQSGARKIVFCSP